MINFIQTLQTSFMRLRPQSAGHKSAGSLARMARAGNGDAAYALGKTYLEAINVPPSVYDAVHWLKIGANFDHVPCQILLATLYLRGVPLSSLETRSGSPDYDQAQYWAERACRQKSKDAWAILGTIASHKNQPDQAFKYFSQGHALGSPQASLGLALMLLTKSGDSVEVVKLLEIAHAAGLTTATFLLGVLYERGQAVSRDEIKATELFRQAAEHGIVSAMTRYAGALLEGLGTQKDREKGETWLRKAALSGDAEAMIAVGNLYSHGGATPPNYAEALIWYNRAAELHHPRACVLIAQIYLRGSGVQRDPKTAASWFYTAANLGDATAKDCLIQMFQSGEAPEYATQVRAWYQDRANQNDALSAFQLAVCYAKGIGGEKDDQKAFIWMRMAAQTFPLAKFWYGQMLIASQKNVQDIQQGREYVEQAAKQGLKEAQALMADLCLRGIGAPPDIEQAAIWLERAAEQEHAPSMLSLGILLSNGMMKADNNRSSYWINRASDKGYKPAQTLLEHQKAASSIKAVSPIE